MKYRLEVWVYGDPRAIYHDNDIDSLVQTYKEDWGDERGTHIIYVYEDGHELSIDEEYELGFYD